MEYGNFIITLVMARLMVAINYRPAAYLSLYGLTRVIARSDVFTRARENVDVELMRPLTVYLNARQECCFPYSIAGRAASGN